MTNFLTAATFAEMACAFARVRGAFRNASACHEIGHEIPFFFDRRLDKTSLLHHNK